MSRLLLIISAAIVVAGASVGLLSAQTPDGETPAEESVCDVLHGATPGLYGLCVAYCEAHDCQPDASLESFVSHCKPGSPKILNAYNNRKQDGDPEMPCRVDACPCFTVDELLGLSPYVQCSVDEFDAGGNLFTQIVKDPNQFILGNVIIFGQDRYCYFDNGEIPSARFTMIDPGEYAVCKQRLLDAMELGSCP